MSWRRLWLVGLAPLVACGLWSCWGSGSCTAMSCNPTQLAIELQTDAPWADGMYVVTLTEDGVPTTCTATLAAGPTTGGHQLVGAPSCTRREVTLQVSTYADATPGTRRPTLDGVQSSTAPTNVSLSVARDGVELSAATFRPSYQRMLINGDCEDVCLHADATVAVTQ